MLANASPLPTFPSTGGTSDNPTVKATDACPTADWGSDRCLDPGTAKVHHDSYPDKDCDHLPNCKITQSQIGALSGKIDSKLSVTDLTTGGDSAIFALANSTAGTTGDAVRDRNKDKVTQLTVTSGSDKPSSNADFYVNKDGVVTVAQNPDHNKNTALTIEFENNPASAKKASELTAEEQATLAAQKLAINVLTEYLRDGYADSAKLQVIDDKNMVADYLKSPNLEPNNPALPIVTSDTTGVGPGVIPHVGFSGRFHQPGPYPGAGYPSAYANSNYPSEYQNTGNTGANSGVYSGNYGVREPRTPLGGLLGTGMQYPHFYMGNWNQFAPQETLPSVNPFEITGDSLLDWLGDFGINLGNPPDWSKLEAAVKKLEKQNPDLAKTLKSPEFTDMLKHWKETGHAPTSAELAKALPEKLRNEVSHDLMHRYASQFKDDKGHVDWGKVAVSEHVGHKATDADMTQYRDIATAATGPDMSKYQRGQEVPLSDRRAIIMQGLQLAGANVTEQNIDCINQIAVRESSWIWDNVNNWDSNAEKGTPSIGVMQTIGPTFQENHVKGCDNIYNPTHNIAAAVRYMAARYGDGNPNVGIVSVASRDSGY